VDLVAKRAFFASPLALLIGVFFACAPPAPDWSARDRGTVCQQTFVRSSGTYPSCDPLIDHLKAKTGFTGRNNLAPLTTAAASETVCGLDLNRAADRVAASADLCPIRVPRAPPSVL